MSYLKVKKLKKEAKLLTKRKEDAGYDIYGIFEKDYEILKPGDIKLIATGLAIEIPKNKVFFICERGSTGTKGFARRSGVVDSGYRGEIFVPINNTSNKSIIFYKDENGLDEFLQKNNLEKSEVTLYPQSKAIAQAMIFDVYHLEVEEVDELSNSERGEGALGSTNK